MDPHPKNASDEILKVENVTVAFGEFKALNDLTFSVARGELRVVIGPNGAGKTTLLDVISGKTRPRSGKVWFQPARSPRTDVTRLPVQKIARLGVGRKFQTPNVFKELTVLDNLRLALNYDRGIMATLLAPFRQDGRMCVEEILRTIGMELKAYRKAGTLAHGEKQWLEIGMVMAQEPELLLIDEPVAGMTPRDSELTGELLMAMSQRHTILVIEHDMTFVRQIAAKVTVLDAGQTLCEGSVQEVQNDPRVIEVYLGQDREEYAPDREPTGVADAKEVKH
jgi:urea transport system ATP-binding protein